MRSIDVHSHLTPQAYWRAVESGGDWYGARWETDEEGRGWLITEGRRQGPLPDKAKSTPQERMLDMDSIGVDVHLVSVSPMLFNYHLESSLVVKAAREVNDEIAGMTMEWPQRFSGLATLPLPDVRASIAELERSVHQLGLKGAELSTNVNGLNWDEPEFMPLFKAAEEMGALLFFHPSGSLVSRRSTRYHLTNTIGNTTEDTVVVASLIFGGILDRCPDLKVCIAHGGGPACFGMGRLDRGWQVRPEARTNIVHPPSRYMRSIYYDCITHNEAALVFMINTIGVDKIVLGSDWPYDMGLDSPVAWINDMESLTQSQKEAILWRNLERLLDI